MKKEALPKTSDILRINLLRLRREQKLSLEKLAKLTGVSRAMLHEIEKGRSVPTLDLADRIAHGLKVSTIDLLTAHVSEKFGH